MRNFEAEKEMIEISKEVWKYLGKNAKYNFPRIESKQGGSTGVYYSDQNMVKYRWNSWNKMPLAGKRMLAIHELWHATGNNHDSKDLFCHSFDILTIKIHKKIYGKAHESLNVIKLIQEIIKNL